MYPIMHSVKSVNESEAVFLTRHVYVKVLISEATHNEIT